MRFYILVGLVIAYFIYLLLGAVVFMYMERDIEKIRCEEAKFAKSLWMNQTVKNEGFTVTQLNGFIENVTKYSRFGISLVGEVKCPTNWNFESSFFFCGTIITTIGYGKLAPTLWYSQIFCIFYALFGIPLFAIMFAGIGEHLSEMLEKIIKNCDQSIVVLNNESKISAKLMFKLLIVGGLSVVFFHLIPAIIFAHVEEWSYLESFYYCFITLTTIGFGDFVAGKNPHKHYIAVYRVMVYFWILFGLAYTFTAIELIVNSIRHSVSHSETVNRGVSAVDQLGDEVRSEISSLLGTSDSEADQVESGEAKERTSDSNNK